MKHQLNKSASSSSSSSNEWLRRRNRDRFTKQSGVESFRCRSAYKLQQINDRYKLLKPGHVVIDCGAAPGSWSQVAVTSVNSLSQNPTQPAGTVIGIDLRHIAPLDGAHLLGGHDFTSPATQRAVAEILKGQGCSKADVILSDMAPSATGIKSHNHDVIVQLCFTVLTFCLSSLRPGGAMLCKLWSGSGQPKLTAAMKTVFDRVRIVKPDASYADSAEIFILGQGFRYKKAEPSGSSSHSSSCSQSHHK